jgi:hypothetical protein
MPTDPTNILPPPLKLSDARIRSLLFDVPAPSLTAEEAQAGWHFEYDPASTKLVGPVTE